MDSCFCAFYCMCSEECICEPDCMCTNCYRGASGSSRLASDTSGTVSKTAASEYATPADKPARPSSSETDYHIMDLNGGKKQPTVTSSHGSSHFAKRSSSKSRRTGKNLTIPKVKDDASVGDSEVGGSNPRKQCNWRLKATSQNIPREAGEGPSHITDSDADKLYKNEKFLPIMNPLQHVSPRERSEYLMSQNFSLRELLQLPGLPRTQANQNRSIRPRVAEQALSTLSLYSLQGLPRTNLSLPGMSSRYSLQSMVQLNLPQFLRPPFSFTQQTSISSDLEYLRPLTSIRRDSTIQSSAPASLDSQSLSSFQNHPNIPDSFPPKGSKSISQSTEQKSSFASNESISASSQNQKQSTFLSDEEMTAMPSNRNGSDSRSSEETFTFKPNKEIIFNESTFSSAAAIFLNRQRASELPQNLSPQIPIIPSSGTFRMPPYSPLLMPPKFIPNSKINLFLNTSNENVPTFRQRASEMPDNSTRYVPLSLLEENVSPGRQRGPSSDPFRMLLTPFSRLEVSLPFLLRSTSTSNENVPTLQTDAETPAISSDNEPILRETEPNLHGEDSCSPNLQNVEETLSASVDQETSCEDGKK